MGFLTPTGNIMCAVALDIKNSPMRCSLEKIDHPIRTRPAGCVGDWNEGSVIAFGATGQPIRACISDALAPDDYPPPKLTYGRTWRAGPITCHARRDGLHCLNPEWHGFDLSRERQMLF